MDNIELPAVPSLKPATKYVCEFCGKSYKTKAPWEKHRLTCQQFEIPEEVVDDAEYDEEYELPKTCSSNELELLKRELQNILISNPSIDITKPISTLNFEQINRMTKEELQARVFDAKKQLNQKLDSSISSAGLSIVNLVVGKFLNCLDELNEAVSNDKVLQDSARDMLTFNILSQIPPPIKVTGLYAMDVGVALKRKNDKNIEKSSE